MGQIKAKSNMPVRKISREDSLTRMKAAFFDLWLDTEERPRIPKAHREIRRLIKLHLAETEMYTAEIDFVLWQKELDRGLRLDDIDDIVIPAQKELRMIYERLFEAIFGVAPRRGE